MPPQRPIANITSCKDIVKCVYSLNDLEVEVYKATVRRGPARADELADFIGKERSTVYRSLQKLISCGMCYRESKSLEKGGYYHVYSAIPKEELISKMEKCVEEWNKRMRESLDRFDESFYMD
jgi:predicted transcriptional regulator